MHGMTSAAIYIVACLATFLISSCVQLGLRRQKRPSPGRRLVLCAQLFTDKPSSTTRRSVWEGGSPWRSSRYCPVVNARLTCEQVSVQLCAEHFAVQSGSNNYGIMAVQEAGIAVKLAPTIGIAVDHRRHNRSLESLQVRWNVLFI